tara:strand:- start:236 stop:511 length:276 start_codon:yes stop_codon:yes gene_type:complete
MLLTPLAYSDVILLEWNMDDAKATQFQILCVFSSVADNYGYQYLQTNQIFTENKIIKADQIFLSDNPPVITQMFEHVGGSSVPIGCVRPNK